MSWALPVKVNDPVTSTEFGNETLLSNLPRFLSTAYPPLADTAESENGVEVCQRVELMQFPEKSS